MLLWQVQGTRHMFGKDTIPWHAREKTQYWDSVMFKRRHNTVIYSRQDTNTVVCSREDTIVQVGLGDIQGKTQYHGVFEGRHNTVMCSREDTVSGLDDVQEKTQNRDVFERRHKCRDMSEGGHSIGTRHCSREDTIQWYVRGQTQYIRGKTQYRDKLERRHSIET